MARVLLVEDHTAFRQALAFMINREPDLDVAGQAGSLAEARGQLTGIDVAVVDIDLGDGSGVELIPDLRNANPQGMVLMLTGTSDEAQIAAAVEAGAAGVLHKSVPINEIIEAIRRLSAGEILMSPQEIINLLRFATRRRAEERKVAMMTAQLTPREFDVLQALATGASDKEIAQELHVSTETVRTHMVNILGKLDVSSRLQALVFAVRHGLVDIG